MSMLADPKRKQKLGPDPRNTFWSNDESKFGFRMLENMGWRKGKGLGLKESGMTDHVKATLRTNDDVRGLGCSRNYADNWIAHQDNFSDILASLNNDGNGSSSGNNNSEDPSDGTTSSGGAKRFVVDTAEVSLSLEEKSKTSRSRVHYHRFTRGKDLSSRSADDLNCIFGRRKGKKAEDVSNTVSESESHSEEESSSANADNNDNNNANNTSTSLDKDPHTHGIKTIISSSSVQEYFAMKMAELKRKREGSASNGSNSDCNGTASEHCSDNLAESASVCALGENGDGALTNGAFVIRCEASSVSVEGKVKKKKKKKKARKEEEEEEEEEEKDARRNGGLSDHFPGDISVIGCVDAESGEREEKDTKKKKKKKKGRNEEEEKNEKCNGHLTDDFPNDMSSINSSSVVESGDCEEKSKSKKKRKRKSDTPDCGLDTLSLNGSVEESIAESESANQGDGPPAKKRKMKRKSGDPSVSDAILGQTSEITDCNGEESVHKASKKKKKKKKSKETGEKESCNSSILRQENDGKSRRRKSVTFSTSDIEVFMIPSKEDVKLLEQQPSSEEEISDEKPSSSCLGKPAKKKRRKRKKEAGEETSASEEQGSVSPTVQKEEAGESSSKKKKKRRKNEEPEEEESSTNEEQETVAPTEKEEELEENVSQQKKKRQKNTAEEGDSTNEEQETVAPTEEKEEQGDSQEEDDQAPRNKKRKSKKSKPEKENQEDATESNPTPQLNTADNTAKASSQQTGAETPVSFTHFKPKKVKERRQLSQDYVNRSCQMFVGSALSSVKGYANDFDD